MESGNQLTFTDAVSMADAQAGYDGLMRGLRCRSLDCLLALNTSQLLNAPVWLHAAPVVDGVNLVDFPRRLLRAGRIKRVPTIVGSASSMTNRAVDQTKSSSHRVLQLQERAFVSSSATTLRPRKRRWAISLMSSIHLPSLRARTWAPNDGGDGG